MKQYLLFFIIASILFFAEQTACSHAMHPESMDRHAEITFTPDKIILIYQAICGLNPTVTYTNRLDADNNDEITDEERTVFVKKIAGEYVEKQVLKIGDEVVPLQFHSGDAYASVGHNGMHVIKVDAAYIGAYPAGMKRDEFLSFLYEDHNFKTVPGWKQMQVSTKDGVQYEGHIPYSEFKPFDYEIISTKGFTPSTEKLTGMVRIPPPHKTSLSTVILPEKIEPPEVIYQADIIVKTVIYCVAGFIVLAIILIAVQTARQQLNSHRHRS